MRILPNKELDANPNLISQNIDSLDNFFFNLPGGYNRIGFYCLEDAPSWVSDEEKASFLRLDPDKKRDYHKDSHSKLYYSRTPREFFRDIDSCLVKTDISLEEIRAINLEAWRNNEGLCNITREHGPKLVPAYLSLRKEGYNHYDIR